MMLIKVERSIIVPSAERILTRGAFQFEYVKIYMSIPHSAS